jgi:hypothetical protein
MAPTISCPERGLITRRSIIGAMAAALLCAPAIVRAANLMPVRRLPFPYGPQYAGFLQRLYFHSLESHLRSLRPDQKTTYFNYRIISVDVARQQVAYAQAHGFLPPYICIYRDD